MSNQKQLIRVFVLIILFAFGCCISAFSQKIPEDLLARISKVQEEVKQAEVEVPAADKVKFKKGKSGK